MNVMDALEGGLGEDDFALIETLLGELSDQGVIAYVLPSIPLGEEWVLGLYDDRGDSSIAKFTSEQVIAFLAGAGAISRRVARQQGILPEIRA